MDLNLFGLEMHLAADQGVISVTIGAVVGVSDKQMVEKGSPGEDIVQLVPVLGPGMPPGHFVVWFDGKNVLVMQKSW